MHWRTFNGILKSLEEIDHQHLSNIYWFSKLLNIINKNSTPEDFKKLIDERFEGKILEYKPKWEFKQEREYLDSRGFINWNTDKTFGEIVHNGQIIGSVEHPSKIRENKFKNILDD